MKISEDEVIQILKIIEESHFQQMHLETGNLKLIVNKGGNTVTVQNDVAFNLPEMAAPSPSTGQEAGEVNHDLEEKETAKPIQDEGLITIIAPLLGIFYRRPDPGSPPYVEVGSFVEENTTVCLIEVMKVFNAVKAGLRGYVQEICAESGKLVEYGQILYKIKPE